MIFILYYVAYCLAIENLSYFALNFNMVVQCMFILICLSLLYYLQGAFVGLLCGLGINIWVYVGSTIYPPGQEFVRKLPVSTADCPVFDVVS